MASELSWRGLATGSTDYVTIRSTARQYWNTSGTPAFENLTVANWANYAIALTETPASSYFYVGSWPATLSTAGFYWVDVFRQLGAGAAISDMLLGTLLGYWDGTTFKPWADDLANWLGTLPLALSSQQVQAVVPTSTVVASISGDVGGKVLGGGASVISAVGAQTDVQTIKGRAINDPGATVTIGTNVAQVGSQMDLVNAPNATALTDIANTLLDLASAIETGLSPRAAMKLIAAACAGTASGLATTTAVYNNAFANTKPRITATVDANGDRLSIVYDIS